MNDDRRETLLHFPGRTTQNSSELRRITKKQGEDVMVRTFQRLRLPHIESEDAQRPAAPPQSASATHALLNLQRTIGNQAVQRLLQPEAQVQRVKTAEERSATQSRRARVRSALPDLAAKVDDKIKKHVFDGQPFDKPVDKNSPQGLHAYTDGALPAGMVSASTEGSTGNVHAIKWHYDDKPASTAKMSTMFPTWMSEQDVLALIAVKFSDNTNVVSSKITLSDYNVTKADVETYVGRGQSFSVKKTGETLYPEM